MTNILEILENNGFSVTDEGNGFFINQYTPAGEDWGFHLDELADIKEYAENFDPDEEFEMWVDAKKNGVAGVPSYAELLHDQIWKRDILRTVANEI